MTMYWRGDYNLDLLKHETHHGAKSFLDVIDSYGLYPLITKPNRISEFSATLINNIFANELTNYVCSGLLITDVSDHLPVFALSRYNIDRSKGKVSNLLGVEMSIA